MRRVVALTALSVTRPCASLIGARAYATPGKIKVNVTKADGQKQVVEAPVGTSLMVALRDMGKIHEVEGACEGCMECGTCHVYLSPDGFKKIKKASEAELDVLDSALEVEDTSRLACQIELTQDCDGLEVRLPKTVSNLLM